MAYIVNSPDNQSRIYDDRNFSKTNLMVDNSTMSKDIEDNIGNLREMAVKSLKSRKPHYDFIVDDKAVKVKNPKL